MLAKILIPIAIVATSAMIATPADCKPSPKGAPGCAPAKIAAPAELTPIDGPAIKALLDKHSTVTLVEALEPKYYVVSHLPGAIRMTEPETQAKKLLSDKKAEIVVYCMNTH